MTKTAVFTLTCEHNEQEIYEALGLVEFSIEPHFDRDNITEELLALSKIIRYMGYVMRAQSFARRTKSCT